MKLTLIMALCLSLVLPAAAFADSTAVTLNPPAAVELGGMVSITGASTLDEVIIQVQRPVKSTVFYDIVPVSNGHFFTSFTLSKSEVAGTYKVLAGAGAQVATADLIVKAPSTGGGGGSGDGGTGNGGGNGDGGTGNGGGNGDGSTGNGGGNGTGGSISTGTSTSISTGAPTGTTTAAGKPVTPPVSNATPVQVDTSKNTAVSETAANGRVTMTVTQDDTALTAAFAAAATQDNHGAAPIIFIAYNNISGAGVRFNLSASILAAAALKAPDTIVSLQTNDGEYSLPLSVLDFAAVAQNLGTAADNIVIQIRISPVAADVNAAIQQSAQNISASQLGTAIEFSVAAAGNGKSVELNHFGSTYVSRSVVLASSVDVTHTSVVLYDPSTGQFSFVPALFDKQADGSTKVTFKRNGNSTYAVLTSTRTFNDIGNHWAKADIELLASKLVVNGATDTQFAPESDITRAEFAALLVRSLGLSPDTTAADFTDVRAGDWYAGAIGAAVQSKLVEGFQDQSFKPNDTITREQMAVMVSRAISATGGTSGIASVQTQLLSVFHDRADISSWAQGAVAQAVQAEIITGMTPVSFVPAAKASRAQAVVMLTRLLKYAEFIN
ncbi:S-layer homology domain-containing protein [Paenibacillus sp. FSL E2-0178]|uniref:S-layer homology domain-containing protein n=1 Tax=Paenibacillus sp. FSL E2-0178 TaxID=2921361 RepID=UPI00315920B3